MILVVRAKTLLVVENRVWGSAKAICRDEISEPASARALRAFPLTRQQLGTGRDPPNVRAPPSAQTVERLKHIAKEKHIDFERDVAPRLFDHPGELFINDVYQVIREDLGAVIHLSVKRLDESEVRSWQDLRAIKNELVGIEHEGVELFPAESRLIDTHISSIFGSLPIRPTDFRLGSKRAVLFSNFHHSGIGE